MIKVSIIVPVYNSERFLDRCICSILAQTQPFAEVILVNDGSTDESGSICDKYAESNASIHVLHQENKGVSAARNAGVAIASGDYIAFADSDDWLSSSFNEVLSGVATKTHADIVVGGMKRAADDFSFCSCEGIEAEWDAYSAGMYMDVFLRVRGNRCVHYPWGKLFRRSIVEENVFPVGIRNGEDAVAFFKMLGKARSVVEVTFPTPLYAYYLNCESVTGAIFGESYLDLPKVWDEIERIANERQPELRSKVLYNKDRVWFSLLCESIVCGTSATDRKYQEEIKEWRMLNKKAFGRLLGSPMVARRKMLMVLITCFFPQLRCVYRRLMA